MRTIVIVGACLALTGAGAFTEVGTASTAHKLWGYEFTRTDAGERIYYLDYTSPSERIEITVMTDIDRQFADETIREKILLFGSLFERQRVGYPGQHTEYIECKPEFKPVYSEKSVDGGTLKYFKGFASERFAFGACDEQSVAYLAVNAYIYCENEKALYDINYFSLTKNQKDTDSFIDRVQCR